MLIRLICFFFCIMCYAEEKIFFLHIPKTGGISFQALIETHYSKEAVFIKNKKNWKECSLNEKEQLFLHYDLIIGHFLYQEIQGFSKDFKKVTILRDPVARVLSEHRYCADHVRKDPKSTLQEHFLPVGGDPLQTAENVVCKFLSKLDPFDLTITIEEHLASAKDSLINDFNFVGITEDMEGSVKLLFAQLNWAMPEEIPMLNTTNSNEHYSESLLQEIAMRNWADIELYQLAKELFEKRKNLPLL